MWSLEGSYASEVFEKEDYPGISKMRLLLVGFITYPCAIELL